MNDAEHVGGAKHPRPRRVCVDTRVSHRRLLLALTGFVLTTACSGPSPEPAEREAPTASAASTPPVTAREPEKSDAAATGPDGAESTPGSDTKVEPADAKEPAAPGEGASDSPGGGAADAFAALVDRLVADVATTEATALVGAIDEASASKSAWVHYKAKRPAMAAPWFARAAALGPTSWKPAHNLACSLALVERWDDAAIAVRESIRRGGAKARERAKSDGDLAGLRTRSGWDELVATSDPAETPADVAGAVAGATEGESPADDAAGEDTKAVGASTFSKAQLEAWGCPPDLVDDDHVCTIDIDGAFTWSPLVFDTIVDVAMPSPKKPRGAEWVALSRSVFTAKLKKQIDFVAPSEDPVFSGPHDSVVGYISDNPLEHDDDENAPPPLMWWGGSDVPVLILNHPQDERGLSVYTLTLLMKVGETWKARTLDVVNPKLAGPGVTGTLFSGHFMRKDGLELFTWSTNYDRKRGDKEDHHYDSWLCRIRWRDGVLQRACVDTWTNREDAP